MAGHKPQSVELAQIFGYEPDDLYGVPEKEEAVKPQGFQEEVPSIEELLAEMPAEMPAEAVVEEVPEMVEEEVAEEVSLVDQLKTIIENEETAEDIKSTAEELSARLEELQAAEENAKAFLADNAPAEEVAEEVAELEI